MESASSSIVKCQSFDLIEGKDLSSFTEFRKLSNKVNALVQAWVGGQGNLEDEKLTEKESQNLHVEKRRNEDLEKLKKVGGPFTNSADVKAFVEDDSIVNAEKSSRLYTEIRYCRDTSLSLPKSSDIFRLKRKYKSLPVEEYATNLSIYLDKVQSNESVTMDDFRNVLDTLVVE